MINNKDEVSLSSEEFPVQPLFFLLFLPSFFFYYLLPLRPQRGKASKYQFIPRHGKVMRTLAIGIWILCRKYPLLPKTYLFKTCGGNGGKSEQIIIVSSTRLILYALILKWIHDSNSLRRKAKISSLWGVHNRGSLEEVTVVLKNFMAVEYICHGENLEHEHRICYSVHFCKYGNWKPGEG